MGGVSGNDIATTTAVKGIFREQYENIELLEYNSLSYYELIPTGIHSRESLLCLYTGEILCIEAYAHFLH